MTYRFNQNRAHRVRREVFEVDGEIRERYVKDPNRVFVEGESNKAVIQQLASDCGEKYEVVESNILTIIDNQINYSRQQ